MKHFIRLRVIKALAIVSCLSGAGVMTPAAVSSTEAIVGAPQERRIVPSWPVEEIRKVWASLSESEQQAAHDVMRPGGTNPLWSFPPGIVSLIFSYLDTSKTHSITKDQLIRQAKGDPSRSMLQIHQFKPLLGIDTEADDNHYRLKLYIFWETSLQGKMRYCFFIGSQGDCEDRFTSLEHVIPARILLKKINISFVNPDADKKFACMQRQDRRFIDFARARENAKKNRLDCRIEDYDEKEGGGTIVSWNVYNNEDIKKVCALYCAALGYDVKESGRGEKRKSVASGDNEASVLKRSRQEGKEEEKEF